MIVMLRHSPADIARRVIIELGGGTDPQQPAASQSATAWPVFAEGQPDKPDSAVMVFSQEGILEGRHMIDGSWAEHKGVQILIRAANHSNGFARVELIVGILDAMYQQVMTLGAYRYLVWSFSRRGQPIPLGNEAGTNRKMFSLNYLMNVQAL